MPIFLSQSALAAIHEHVATSVRPGQGILGFLLGDVCECPDTNAFYLVIDAALRLNQALYNDRSRDVVTRLWDRIQTQLEEQQAHLLGWYHTHPPLPLALSPDDVETHEHYFGESWQVAMLLATDPEEPAGAFFRVGTDDWVGTPLPFYELLQDDSIRPDGKKRSFVTWKNYRAYNPVAPPAGSMPRAPTARPPLEPRVAPRAAPSEPEPELAPEPEPPPPAPPPPARRPPRPEERTSELKFLTAAEDFAHPAAPAPPPPPPAPARRPGPPARPPREPPVAQPAPTEPIPYEPEGTEAEAWPSDELVEAEQPMEEGEPEPPPPPPPTLAELRRRRARRRRLWRRVWRTALALVIIAGAGAAYWWFQPRLPSPNWSAIAAGGWSAVTSTWSAVRARLRRPPPAPRAVAPPRPPPPRSAERSPPPPPAPYARLDRLGDSLAVAARTFRDRAAQFDRNKLPCSTLALWLVAVEGRWTAYTGARRAAGTLDPAHTARDQSLFATVDSVERRFEKSGCERP
ncbi:MAG TPA: hypothetical protein VEU55_02660 [Gemmatimonadales bacterium]|nr:hypothetical protein [Gemmatimonadales bacterium]